MPTPYYNGPALAAVLALAAAASPAHAAFPTIGFVGTLGGTPSSVESFNSTGGTNSVAILGTGLFQVTLPGLGNGLNSNVQVNASNTNGHPHICTSQGWGSNGVDVIANVGCFDFSGNPVSADFSLFYQARSSAPGGWLGYLWANQPTAASYTPDANYNYNNTGGTNTVTRQGVGLYTATFPGLRGGGGNPQVTAYTFSGGVSARCEISSWTETRSTDTQVSVACFDGHGLPADEFFSLAYNRSTLEGEGEMSGLYAHAYNPTRRHYTPHEYYTEIGGSNPTAERFGRSPGQYSMSVSNASGGSPLPILGMVTAIGTQGEYCEVDGYDDVGSGPFDMNLVCYDAQERQTNLPYSAEMFFRLP